MRWITRKPPYDGQKRTRRKFALWPIQATDDGHTYWLERVEILERFSYENYWNEGHWFMLKITPIRNSP